MQHLPLTDKGHIANSLALFVLENPQYTDIISAYNAWVKKERTRAFPWGEAWMTVYCFTILDTCLNQLTREQLEELYEDEEIFLLAT